MAALPPAPLVGGARPAPHVPPRRRAGSVPLPPFPVGQQESVAAIPPVAFTATPVGIDPPEGPLLRASPFIRTPQHNRVIEGGRSGDVALAAKGLNEDVSNQMGAVWVKFNEHLQTVNLAQLNRTTANPLKTSAARGVEINWEKGRITYRFGKDCTAYIDAGNVIGDKIKITYHIPSPQPNKILPGYKGDTYEIQWIEDETLKEILSQTQGVSRHLASTGQFHTQNWQRRSNRPIDAQAPLQKGFFDLASLETYCQNGNKRLNKLLDQINYPAAGRPAAIKRVEAGQTFIDRFIAALKAEENKLKQERDNYGEAAFEARFAKEKQIEQIQAQILKFADFDGEAVAVNLIYAKEDLGLQDESTGHRNIYRAMTNLHAAVKDRTLARHHADDAAGLFLHEKVIYERTHKANSDEYRPVSACAEEFTVNVVKNLYRPLPELPQELNDALLSLELPMNDPDLRTRLRIALQTAIGETLALFPAPVPVGRPRALPYPPADAPVPPPHGGRRRSV